MTLPSHSIALGISMAQNHVNRVVFGTSTVQSHANNMIWSILAASYAFLGLLGSWVLLGPPGASCWGLLLGPPAETFLGFLGLFGLPWGQKGSWLQHAPATCNRPMARGPWVQRSAAVAEPLQYIPVPNRTYILIYYVLTYACIVLVCAV